MSRKQFRSALTHPEGIGKTPWPTQIKDAAIYLDEVGQGAWVGPLTIGATFLMPGFCVQGIHDSKLLKPHEREKIYEDLKSNPTIVYHVEHMTNSELDSIGGLGPAWRVCLARAVDNLLQKLKLRNIVAKEVILDGNKEMYDCPLPVTSVVRADSIYVGVAAAAIMAKVERDRYMESVAADYPMFKTIFRDGKGYRHTVAHDQLIAQGIFTPLHRTTYNPLKTWLASHFESVVEIPKPVVTFPCLEHKLATNKPIVTPWPPITSAELPENLYDLDWLNLATCGPTVEMSIDKMLTIPDFNTYLIVCSKNKVALLTQDKQEAKSVLLQILETYGIRPNTIQRELDELLEKRNKRPWAYDFQVLFASDPVTSEIQICDSLADAMECKSDYPKVTCGLKFLKHRDVDLCAQLPKEIGLRTTESVNSEMDPNELFHDDFHEFANLATYMASAEMEIISTVSESSLLVKDFQIRANRDLWELAALFNLFKLHPELTSELLLIPQNILLLGSDGTPDKSLMKAREQMLKCRDQDERNKIRDELIKERDRLLQENAELLKKLEDIKQIDQEDLEHVSEKQKTCFKRQKI